MTPVKGPSRKHALPWFPFDAEEFLSTSTFIIMGLPERGAYITLCAWQWLEGYLPGEVAKLAKLVSLSASEFEPIWQEIAVHFPMLLDGSRANPEVAEARDHQIAKQAARRVAGHVGGKARHGREPTLFDDTEIANGAQATAETPAQAGDEAPGKANASGYSSTDASLSSSNSHSRSRKKKRSVSQAAIKRVFGYWEERRAKVLGVRRVPMKLTGLRAGKIKARLGEGYTEPELQEAVEGCLATKFNVQNGHTDIELICRDQAHVERYMQSAPKREADDGRLDHLGG